MSNTTRNCDGCGKVLWRWRQCGVAGATCKHEVGYCEECGGDKRSVLEMVQHIAFEHGMYRQEAPKPAKVGEA